MEFKKSIELTLGYREKLIEYGKRVALENPDNLEIIKLKALVERIFEELNDIDMSMGYEYHDFGAQTNEIVSQEEKKKLFLDFIDWYQVVPTLSNDIYEYVTKNYSVKKYPKILCVGDGENCHLGRKLAKQGYQVVSVDPLARKEFSGDAGNKGGKFHVVKGEFFDTSSDMIDWASLVVGAKVPLCAENLIGLKKPAVFNISQNAEIYKMRFKGEKINSSEQLAKLIMKCPGISVETKVDDILGEEIQIFVSEGREFGERDEI